MVGLIDMIAARYDEAEMVAVEVPEWETTLHFRPLTAAERSRIRRGIDPNDEEELVVKLIIAKALDADGNRVFDDDAKTRAALMGKADMNVIMRIAQEAGRSQLVGDGEGEAVEQAKNA
jgi:hypothetical protein